MKAEDKEVIRALESRILAAESKAETAAQVALGAVETIRHMQSAAEHSHAKEAEQLSAMRKMVAMVESMAKVALSQSAGN